MADYRNGKPFQDDGLPFGEGPAGNDYKTESFIPGSYPSAAVEVGHWPSSRPICHDGTVEAFRDPKSNIQVCGGGSSRGVEFIEKDLCINLANVSTEPCVSLNMPEKYSRGLVRFTQKVDEVSIRWADRGVPSLSKDFWVELVRILRVGNYRRMVFCCMGGHGRTGTALSIMASLCDVVPDKGDPVPFIRKDYCKNAVETDDQCDYITKMTGRIVYAEPSDSYRDFKWPKKEKK